MPQGKDGGVIYAVYNKHSGALIRYGKTRPDDVAAQKHADDEEVAEIPEGVEPRHSKLRLGDKAPVSLTAKEIAEKEAAASSPFVIPKFIGLPICPRGELPAPRAGLLTFVPDAQGGPCLAVSDGADWFRINLGGKLS